MAFQWTSDAVERLTLATLEGEAASAIAAALGCCVRTVQDAQIGLGLRESQRKRVWTAKERQTIRRLYPDTETKSIAEQLGRTVSQVYQCAAKMGLHKSPEYLLSPAACRLRRGDNVGAQFRYPKGHVPANKGLRRPGWAPGRMSETQFRRGALSGKAAENWMPIGTIRQDTDGYLRIKVREHLPGEHSGFGNTKVWPLLHRHNWEKEKGPIPAGYAVVFKTRDRSNCAVENLELISRGELMRRNTIHNYPPELKSTIMYLGALKRKVRERAEKLNGGPAQPSV